MLAAVFERSSGEVWIVSPVPSDPPRKGESATSHIERIVAQALAGDPLLRECASRGLTDISEIPQSRRFRTCWRIAAGRVSVDMPLARQQVLSETRRERNARLAASDSDKARLDDLGTPSQKSDIAKYRQDLRDLPARVQMEIAALDLAALEAYKPAFPAKPI